MAKIKLAASTGGAFISKAGKNVLLQIIESDYDQDFGKVSIVLQNKKGETMQNNFNLLDAEGSLKEGALKAFSYFSRVALGDWSKDDIEAEELVGCVLRGDIVMTKGNKPGKSGEDVFFANLDKVYMASDEDRDLVADTFSSKDKDTSDDDVEDASDDGDDWE